MIDNKENERIKALNQAKKLKKRFMGILKEKFVDMHSNLRRLRTNCETICDEYQGLVTQQMSYLPNQIMLFKRNQMGMFEEETEKIKYELENRYKKELNGLQEKNEQYENEMKRKYESQFEDWSRKSLELTRKMEDIQNNSKKLQGEIYSLLKEKDAYGKEIELLKTELEKALGMAQNIAKEKSDLQANQEGVINAYVNKIQDRAKKNEKKYLKTLKLLKKDVEALQEKNIKNLSEINEGVEALQERYESEIRSVNKNSNEKGNLLKEKLSDYESLIDTFKNKCNNYENIINSLEKNINDVNDEKDQMVVRYDNHIYVMTQNLEDITTTMRQEKDKHMKELIDKNMEIDTLKNKSNRLELDNKRKDEEIYTMRSERNKLNHQYEEAMLKFSLKNSQCEKEVQEQVQEKRKYEEEVENLQNLLTKKYHKINENKKINEVGTFNLDEKVKKLHDLEEELKVSLRTKTVVSPERGKISTPMIKHKSVLNKQYYSSLTAKKNMISNKK